MILLRSPNYPEGDGRATANSPTYGHLGNSYPAHLDDSALLGLSRADRQALAVLDNRKCGVACSHNLNGSASKSLCPRSTIKYIPVSLITFVSPSSRILSSIWRRNVGVG